MKATYKIDEEEMRKIIADRFNLQANDVRIFTDNDKFYSEICTEREIPKDINSYTDYK